MDQDKWKQLDDVDAEITTKVRLAQTQTALREAVHEAEASDSRDPYDDTVMRVYLLCLKVDALRQEVKRLSHKPAGESEDDE